MATTASWGHHLIRLCMIACLLAKHAAATTIIKTHITSTNTPVDAHATNSVPGTEELVDHVREPGHLGNKREAQGSGKISSVLAALHKSAISGSSVSQGTAGVPPAEASLVTGPNSMTSQDSERSLSITSSSTNSMSSSVYSESTKASSALDSSLSAAQLSTSKSQIQQITSGIATQPELGGQSSTKTSSTSSGFLRDGSAPFASGSSTNSLSGHLEHVNPLERRWAGKLGK